MLLADRIQIQQVVTNLILNSTEVMESVEPETRKLIIGLSTAPLTLRLRSVQARVNFFGGGGIFYLPRGWKAVQFFRF